MSNIHRREGCRLTGVVDVTVGMLVESRIPHLFEDDLDGALALACRLLETAPLQELVVIGDGGDLHHYQRLPDDPERAFLSVWAPDENAAARIADARAELHG